VSVLVESNACNVNCSFYVDKYLRPDGGLELIQKEFWDMPGVEEYMIIREGH
jgi:hypothetical protein